MGVDHDSLVSWLVMELKQQGFDRIEADHLAGHQCPPAIGRHVPDVLAYQAGTALVVGEAKTLESFDNERSIEQYYDYINSGLDFKLVVPDQVRDGLKTLLRELQLYPHANLSIL